MKPCDNDPRVNDLELLAWIGEDELGSGKIGLKGALVPAGYVPMVAMGDDMRMADRRIADQLQQQANTYGKTIRLCRFKFEEVVETLEPQ